VGFRLEGAQGSTAKRPAPGKGVPARSFQKATTLVLARGWHGVQVAIVIIVIAVARLVQISVLSNHLIRDQGSGDFVQDHRVLFGTGIGGMQVRVFRGNGQANHGLSRCHIILEGGSQHTKHGENDGELHDSRVAERLLFLTCGLGFRFCEKKS
jgi:hypothetical protein